ncbi:histone deacetylase family protein [Calycomorphotria hydatis]|uniref:Histone deacetylase-like amidohydrolase n=1 Tax=Calycomorphotria hydatis TaxID=2528027 RepID=A0A517T7K8_9PLAN|nr:histone deacetylase [Calycomorphotria hydatis]QDT64355.1 Histone deacetylase-like amidohydrolase [Calycomorphotria hydatis]
MPKLFYTDHFVLPLPERHRFPMSKYRLLRELLEATPGIDAQLEVPPAATDEQLLRAHTDDYVERVTQGRMTRQEVLRSGFPWSPQLVERSRRSSGATISAARAALEDGFAANLAGGTHHAFADAAEGYCIFNDAAVAARDLQATGEVERVMVIDCDVHQGNGTAAICRGDESIFTFSIHGAKNFPSRKELSDLDVPLPDGIEDEAYLAMLAAGLEDAFAKFTPDLVIYTSGADPFMDDRLGRMRLTKQGLLDRDRLVYSRCHDAAVPVAVTMAGGYAENVADIVEIHANTILSGLDIMTGCRA